MNTAIIITGTICSGKSTLSNRLSESLGYDLLNENNPKHFFGMIDKITTGDFKSPVIIEHTDILNMFDENKEYDIGKYFDKKIIVLMNVSADILKKNIDDRKSRGVTGEYLKMDMLAMKKDIENKFNGFENGFIKYVANIDIIDDYEEEYKKIVAFLTNCLCIE